MSYLVRSAVCVLWAGLIVPTAHVDCEHAGALACVLCVGGTAAATLCVIPLQIWLAKLCIPLDAQCDHRCYMAAYVQEGSGC
jgi:hypothetical protein